MVGIIILAHGDLGLQFITTARLIGLNSEESVVAISVIPADTTNALREQVAQAIKNVDRGNGVLILTDLFGGTPTNLSLAFLEEGKVEVVTGLNLPMVIKAINSRADHDLRTLARLASEAGKENIFLAGDFLRQRPAKKKANGESASNHSGNSLKL
jgi:mannose PTS system EIIA component